MTSLEPTTASQPSLVPPAQPAPALPVAPATPAPRLLKRPAPSAARPLRKPAPAPSPPVCSPPASITVPSNSADPAPSPLVPSGAPASLPPAESRPVFAITKRGQASQALTVEKRIASFPGLEVVEALREDEHDEELSQREKKRKILLAKLEKLDRVPNSSEFKVRVGKAGMKFIYLPTFRVMMLMNEVFEVGGWSSEILSLTREYCDQGKNGQWDVGFRCVMQVKIHTEITTCCRQGVGFGTGQDAKKGEAFEKACKESESDAFKRACRSLGKLLGICWDGDWGKAMLEEIAKKLGVKQ